MHIIIVKEELIIRLLPRVYNRIDRPMNRYQILMALGLSGQKADYQKIEELKDMGFLVNGASPRMLSADKKAIWEFLKKTPLGKEIIELMKKELLVLE